MLSAEPEFELDATAEAMARAPRGAYRTTPQLMRGNLGERLATEALAAMGHQILGYKPDISGTSRPGVDIVTLQNGQVWLIDNKAYSRGGTIRGASALARNFRRNLGQVRGQLASMAFDPQRSSGEHGLLQRALQLLNTGHYVRAVTNANVSRQNKIPTGLHPSLQRKGIVFLDVFRGAGVPAPMGSATRVVSHPGRRRLRPSRLRELELARELESGAAELEEEEAEPFFTRVQPVPHLPGYEEGHEVLTRVAARGLVAGSDLNALLLGVIRPDRGGASYWNFPRAALHAFNASAQRSHALRRTSSTSQAAALSEIRRHLATLYLLAIRARNRAIALGWIGEAMHLIQDSYSGAHMERALGRGPGGTSPIRRIRAFYLTLWPPRRSTAPHEHNVPSDPRDRIWKSRGVLTNEARFAVRASREYLTMMLRHVRYPGAPANIAEFRAFLKRHFRF
jgi:hypothetical protein